MISIRDLVKSYARGSEIVTACSIAELDVAAGEQIAVSGRSGAGKTTLLHLLAGISRPDRGRIEVAGVLVHELGEAARDRFRAQHIGLVFQTLNLLQPFNALENVMLGAVFGRGLHRGSRERAERLLERVGLADRRFHRPGEMSLGQAQRVAICRALINDPEVLLADEPLGSQDRSTGLEVLELLLELAGEGGRAFVMVTHDLDSAARMQRTVDLAELQRAG